MDLWIRSQNKQELAKAEHVGVYDNKVYINGYDEYGYRIAEYKSKERALEVLDEIQNILKPKYILDSSSIKPNGDNWIENGIVMQNYSANARIEELSTYVYEMPKD